MPSLGQRRRGSRRDRPWSVLNCHLAMFCDLCLPDHDDLYVQRDRLAMALRLGFDKVAVEHLAKGRLGAQDR